ncbi:MAG: DNA topoisomerase IV subunit B, partial [Deltaproteobacteria bacterium]
MDLFDLEENRTSGTYNAGSIEILKGLDPVRKRPGMYTDTAAPTHLVFEVIDNSVDEAVAGFASAIDVKLTRDNGIRVTDNGRGMPVDIHPDEGITGVELIMTRLHAGAKFSSKDYSFSGGLHGVGVSVANALCKKVEIFICRNGKQFTIVFENGETVCPLSPAGTCSPEETGTSVTLYPDPQYFDSPRVSEKAIIHALQSKAILCPGLATSFENEQSGESFSWYYQQGIDQYLKEQLTDKPCLLGQPFSGHLQEEDFEISWAVTWTAEDFRIMEESYVNLIPTPLGGTHVNGFRSGLLESLREFCKFRNLIPKGLYITPEDLWSHVQYILSVKLMEAQFSGQTKERLSSRQCAHLVNAAVRDHFSLWLHGNVEEGQALAELVIESARKRERQSKKVTKSRTSAKSPLPAKLSDCTSNDLQEREIFFVEGDSAGGSAKQARDRRFQAIMPLRGKILNTWDVSSQNIMDSREIRDIASVLGMLPGQKDTDGLRYGKICVLADADSDGLHIATLLCALFLRHFPVLVQEGHVFIAMPPLY